MAESRLRPYFTLEQLCRALAVHALLTSHPTALYEFFAPETGEQTAQFIHQFALGEPVDRPPPNG